MSLVLRRSSAHVAAVFYSAILAAGVTLLPQLALAQSLFDQLFGSSEPPRVQRAKPQPTGIGGEPLRLRQAATKSDSDSTERRERRESQEKPEARSGSYRTVCVRTCDGFYFPISHKAQRSNFHADADVCRSRCGSTDARLFYHSNTSEINEAVDLAGRSYKSLSAAFLYRKKLVDGCACKPTPWSTAELDRHRSYAAAEGRIPASAPVAHQSVSTATVVAGNYPAQRSEKPAPQTASLVLQVQPQAQHAPTVSMSVAAVAGITPEMALTARSLPEQPRRSSSEVTSPADTLAGNASTARSAKSSRREPKARPEPKPDPKPEPHVATKAVKAAAANPALLVQPRRTAQAAQGHQTQSSYGSSGGYAWPGDAPSRYR